MMKVKCKTVDHSNRLINDVLELTKKRLLVGVPEEENSREQGDGIGNAALAYIHDNGSPIAGIPARPFMKPGIKNAQERLNKELLLVAKSQLNDDPEQVDAHLNRAGLIAQNSIRSVINKGEGFEPLKRGTLLDRLRRRKAARKWDKERREEVMGSMHPLVDTGSMRNAVTYVVEGEE